MKLETGGIRIFPALVITAIFGITYGYSNVERVNAGYFTDGFWMTMNSILYVIFFGLMSGTVLAIILGNLKAENSRRKK